MKFKNLAVGLFSLLFIVSSCGSEAKKEAASESATNEETVVKEKKEEEIEQPKELTVPEGARVFFANLNDGDIVNSPLEIQFGLEGMEIEPAGKLTQGKGHHHIIIDGGHIERGTPVPTNETNIHFGKGQTSTTLELEKGEHTLTLQFADGFHQSYGEQMSNTISVTVE